MLPVAFLQVVGDCVGVDKSTVSRVLNDVTDALAELSTQFILWPSEDQKREVRTGFYKLGGFPSIGGCLDGTHIRMKAPSEDEKSYVNRKKNITVLTLWQFAITEVSYPTHYIPTVFLSTTCIIT